VKRDLIKLAYREAAALLHSDCDAADLACDDDPKLSEEDMSLVREYIRKEIVDLLNRRGTP
jgi:hypothetical protein